MVFSIAASSDKGEVVMANDIGRAFFHAPAKRKVYVQLPEEDRRQGEGHLCGRFKFSMYGTRDAAQNWVGAYSQQVKNIGSQHGKASPCTFYHKQRAIRTYVHGGDYVSVGQPVQLQLLNEMLEKQYQVKTQLLGPKEGQPQQFNILITVIA